MTHPEQHGETTRTHRAPIAEIDPDTVEFYIRRGKHLQARAIRRALGRVWSRLGALVRPRPAAPADATPALAHRMQNSLAAIRSSAELLRDSPEIDPAERSRFADNVLAEERRLEALVAQLIDRGLGRRTAS